MQTRNVDSNKQISNTLKLKIKTIKNIIASLKSSTPKTDLKRIINEFAAMYKKLLLEQINLDIQIAVDEVVNESIEIYKKPERISHSVTDYIKKGLNYLPEIAQCTAGVLGGGFLGGVIACAPLTNKLLK